MSHFPKWLHRPVQLHGQWDQAKRLVSDKRLNTVCEEAKCPNLGECWSHGNVSFMVLGERCTRACSFCAVDTRKPMAVDTDEPRRLAEAIAELGLQYVVITSVARDDLPDEGAAHFAACIEAVRQKAPEVQIEVLTPDFHAKPELIKTVVQAAPDVFNHNLETVRRLTPEIRPQAGYESSLEVLRMAKESGSEDIRTKSGVMVGMGETPDEVLQALSDLRAVDCDILTIGQYLQPTPQHREVTEFITPDQFLTYKEEAVRLGFSYVASGPYVRSSYNAYEALHSSIVA